MKLSEAELQTILEKRREHGQVVAGNGQRSATATPINKAPDKARAPFRSKLEASYSQYLHVLMLSGDIQFYKYEPVRLILGNDCTLTVDFLVMTKEGLLEWHEVKGRKREDAMIKLRVAAKTFHWWKFILVERRRGIWEQREMPI